MATVDKNYRIAELLHVPNSSFASFPRWKQVGRCSWECRFFLLHGRLHCNHCLVMWQPVESLSAVPCLIDICFDGQMLLYVSGAAIGSDGRIYCAWLRNSQSLKQDLCSYSQRANSCWNSGWAGTAISVCTLLAKFGRCAVRFAKPLVHFTPRTQS